MVMAPLAVGRSGELSAAYGARQITEVGVDLPAGNKPGYLPLMYFGPLPKAFS